MEPDAVTSLCLADVEDFAYVLAILAFTVLSWVIGFIKKRTQEKEGAAKPSSDEMFEQAELVEEESASYPASIRPFGRSVPESTGPRIPSPPPMAKPASLPPHPSFAQPTRPARRPVLSTQVPPVARSRQHRAVVLEMPEVGIANSTADILKPDSTSATPSKAPSTTPSTIPFKTPTVPVPGPNVSRSRWRGFATVNAVRQAIVMAEVLGPPIALREAGRCLGDPGSDAQ